ncbi:hypothetical protein Tsubulata_039815 [Turnera subulata]|uniref:Serine carboxypeptidase S28 family protein n=1 Tax=Turnera subulata TaxID=218843 RepID=A0A9Q0JGQ2_9ROSI|nr:hypothetical protein Tsubulata_039815 [Turnera subulata]
MAIHIFCNILVLLSLIAIFSIPLTTSKPGRLSVHGGQTTRNYVAGSSVASGQHEYETHYYKQTLDHFNYQPQSYETFGQRYVVSFKHWKGANASAPILAYLGAEESIDPYIDGIGFLTDNAAQFGALIVYIEHRFYGMSIPFVTMEEALKNETLRGYFNSAQAIADYAEILLHIKRKFSAQNSPIIVVGGSYGGMLAAWFRLKYPHIVLGALASSAPILYFDNISPPEGYYLVATKAFREASESCYKTIKRSWSKIDKVAAAENGLSILAKKFKSCKPLKHARHLKDYLVRLYSAAAQYDTPQEYPYDGGINRICKVIDTAPKGADTLDKIFSGVIGYYGNLSCYTIDGQDSLTGWDWQTCSDLVITMGVDGNETMFPAEPLDMKEYIGDCKRMYGVSPRPHWITTYFGGHNIKVVLRRFGSNIIFSNGLSDPYSSGGVLEDISDSIRAVHTAKGSHCMDLFPAIEYDPEWLVLQKKKEVEIVSGWLLKYYQDLRQDSS